MAWMWLLVLILVIIAVAVKIRQYLRVFIIRQNPFNQTKDSYSSNNSAHQPLSSSRQYFSSDVEKMVSCEFCEVYVPVSEAVERSGKIFCCREHSVAYFSRKHSS